MNDFKILVAEDNRINRIVVKKLLENLGAKVETVSNGEQVLSACRQTDYDLILMDVQMPVLDGLEATRILRERERDSVVGRHIPIVALTAHSLDTERQTFLSAGMDDGITKPVNREMLLKLLNKLQRAQ